MTTAARRTFEHTTLIAAPAHHVFPLLCPVREPEWIPGWSCELIHTSSGLAEKGCVFRTDSPSGRGTMTWVMTAYEPAERVEFTCVATDGLVMRIEAALRDHGGRTTLRWVREYVATGPDGAAWLRDLRDEDVDARTGLLLRRLAHYAETGSALQAA
jgi:uncharacterized protein YndB with AHSA1/START domain